MAKIRKNIIIQGFSGTLGDQLVIKQDKAGRTILAVPPTVDPDRTFSEAQQAQHGRFREAAAYAKDAKAQDVYQTKAKGTPQTPYNVAMADWFHAPEVNEIDVSTWNGDAGDVIRIQAQDNVQVSQVTVVILDASNAVIEQGAAVRQADPRWWHYTTTGDTSNGTQIVAAARDLPGNLAELRWE